MSPRIGLHEELLLQTAAELADEHGFEAVTLAMLAQKLGIRPPSLYNHVEGLSGLRYKLALHGLSLLHDCMSKGVAGLTGDAALYSLGRAYVEFARRHPGLYEATLRAPRQEDTLAARKAGEIVGLVVGVLEAYGLSGDEALHATRGLHSLMHGFASLEQHGGFGLPLDINESLQLLLGAFIAGIHRYHR
ncbi:TetR/AcrR family transcriptional regulator [Paenibacillus lutrae]|uniref:TetR family transcriptional regulator n=1 Tax=Paenibacillus lutrae TaxID=2078573 RepID=A0A7X3K1E5_9BACL|nr:TetR/AcrR family transcriptional regulator [Paenibacillus lutrae]MVP02035.1 TetR family transcriptional regulator [Paenibacillus lutrae]